MNADFQIRMRKFSDGDIPGYFACPKCNRESQLYKGEKCRCGMDPEDADSYDVEAAEYMEDR